MGETFGQMLDCVPDIREMPRSITRYIMNRISAAPCALGLVRASAGSGLAVLCVTVFTLVQPQGQVSSDKTTHH